MRTLNSFYINISQKYFTFHKNILQGQLITAKWAMGNKVVMSVGVGVTVMYDYNQYLNLHSTILNIE